MSTITEETRRASHETVLETVSQRQASIIGFLGTFGKKTRGMTAGELSVAMYSMGALPSPDRNYVHPRLNELVTKGTVFISGKRKCDVSGRTCAVYIV